MSQLISFFRSFLYFSLFTQWILFIILHLFWDHIVIDVIYSYLIYKANLIHCKNHQSTIHHNNLQPFYQILGTGHHRFVNNFDMNSSKPSFWFMDSCNEILVSNLSSYNCHTQTTLTYVNSL